MIGVTIREAGIDDIPALLRFWRTAGENDARPADSAEGVRRLLERDPHAAIVAELEGRIVGTVIAGWDGWRAHLYRLTVQPDLRRRGVGRLLLDAAERRLAALGAIRFDAMVLDGNETGAGAWRARGYARQPDWSRWVRPAPST